MNPPTTPPAHWDSMTDAERIEWLAVKVMGWQLRQVSFSNLDREAWYIGREDGSNSDGTHYTSYIYSHFAGDWNPLTDWNHWRQVEEKVMGDTVLWCHFVTDLIPSCYSDTDYAMMAYAKTTLEQRCKALYIAYQGLQSSRNP